MDLQIEILSFDTVIIVYSVLKNTVNMKMIIIIIFALLIISHLK